MPTLATVSLRDEKHHHHYQNHHPSPFKTAAKHGHKRWTAAMSSALYQVDTWGAPYFSVTPRGSVGVKPLPGVKPFAQPIDIGHVVDRLHSELGLSTPAIVRFPDILRHRLLTLHSAFDTAIKNQGYGSHYQGVYPVKCNQSRDVVETLVEAGRDHHFGLEAGSKPELLLAMSTLCSHGSPNSLLVCNGYKDSEYIMLALLGRTLGLNTVIVLEQEEELDTVLKLSSWLCIDPVIGLRAKLNTKHAGHFGQTSGEKGKFGLSCSEIVSVVHKLRRARKLHCLNLLHFHIGSQIPSLEVLNDGVSEAAHIFCELALMGAHMSIIDIGGGLGIDYDGTKSCNSDMSIGYSIGQYAAEVVKAITNACGMKGIKHPIVCSESGRALVSHHSVLVFDVMSSTTKNNGFMASKGILVKEIMDGLPPHLKILLSSLYKNNDHNGALESARRLKDACIDLFKHGQLSLAQLADINSIYDMVSTNPSTGHNAVYHINLSIFKSMPDTWAIGQLFPVIPLQRLNEEPNVRAILSDLTCDSDGKIDTFVGTNAQGERLNYINVHPLEEGKPYYMGMFLGGAYQEALGGIHNLFGTPNVVNVSRDGKISKVVCGQTSSDVLKVMQYDPITMLESIKHGVQNNVNFNLSFSPSSSSSSSSSTGSSSTFSSDDDDDDEVEKVYPFGIIDTLACSFNSSTYLSYSSLCNTTLSPNLKPLKGTTPPKINTSYNNNQPSSLTLPTMKRPLLPT